MPEQMWMYMDTRPLPQLNEQGLDATVLKSSTFPGRPQAIITATYLTLEL